MNRLPIAFITGLLLLFLAITACSCSESSTTGLPHPTTAIVTPTPTSETSTTSSPDTITAVPTPTLTHEVTSTYSPDPTNATVTPTYTYKVINVYPHDQNAWTQGLVIKDGILYEGTGIEGASTLRRVDLETGNILQLSSLDNRFFGEGITIYENKIFQLTEESHVGFIYDKDSFELLQEFHYPTEGWGITHDGEHLIMSDGTSTLYFWDPETLEEIDRLNVYDKDVPVTDLNELEYINGEIYANVWYTDRIARIDPRTGQVLGWIDLAGLFGYEDTGQPVAVISGQAYYPDAAILNGIAYDAENDRLFVTGKLWPKIFEIELIIREK